MAKFKVGQVVAVKHGERLYKFISGIGTYVDSNQSYTVYFVNGDLAGKYPNGDFMNAYWVEQDFRKLTAREAGR